MRRTPQATERRAGATLLIVGRFAGTLEHMVRISLRTVVCRGRAVDGGSKGGDRFFTRLLRDGRQHTALMYPPPPPPPPPPHTGLHEKQNIGSVVYAPPRSQFGVIIGRPSHLPGRHRAKCTINPSGTPRYLPKRR